MYIEASSKAIGQTAYITTDVSYPADNTDRYAHVTSSTSRQMTLCSTAWGPQVSSR